jgi:hypothetical protein
MVTSVLDLKVRAPQRNLISPFLTKQFLNAASLEVPKWEVPLDSSHFGLDLVQTIS